jgi:hypothetical protein
VLFINCFLFDSGSYIYNNFVTHSTDGREVELKEGGKDIPVTFHNRLEYCDLLEKVTNK